MNGRKGPTEEKKGKRERKREMEREKGKRKGERRDAGTCVSHGLPIATHAANARIIGASYRP